MFVCIQLCACSLHATIVLISHNFLHAWLWVHEMHMAITYVNCRIVSIMLPIPILHVCLLSLTESMIESNVFTCVPTCMTPEL